MGRPTSSFGRHWIADDYTRKGGIVKRMTAATRPGAPTTRGVRVRCRIGAKALMCVASGAASAQAEVAQRELAPQQAVTIPAPEQLRHGALAVPARA